MTPNPPQQIAFSIEPPYLNVFLAGVFAGQIPMLAIPDTDLPFFPDDELAFVPGTDLMFA